MVTAQDPSTIFPQESPIKGMLFLALPMIISQACDTVLIMTARVYLSRVSPELMNASMGGGLAVFVMMSFFIGLTGYATALVAQCLGAGRKQDCALVLTQAIVIAILAYVPILFCRPLAHMAFEMMGLCALQLESQKIFFDILLYGAIINLFRNCFSCFFSGIGRVKVVVVASVAAMLMNLLLGYVLIFGFAQIPAYGIRGAAWAAILSHATAFVILLGAYLRPVMQREFEVLKAFRFDRKLMTTLLRFGSPAGAELALNMFGFNALVMVFHAQGLVTATAATIMFNWDMVSFVPLLGVEIAVTSLVGRAMGAGRPDLAHRWVMSGLWIGLGYSAIVFVFFLGLPVFLTDMFHSNVTGGVFNDARPLAIFMLKVASLYVLVEAFFVVFIGALRGAGDTLWAMFISVGVHWIVVVAVCLAFYVFKLSPAGAWVVVVGVLTAVSLLAYVRYRSGVWKTLKVLD